MQKLILLGASVRGLAQSALRAGFAPFAIDLFADRDLTAVCPAVRIQRYPGDFLAALVAAPPAPWLYSGGLENHPRLIERLARVQPLWGNPGSVLRRLRDPAFLAAAVRDAGLPFPATPSIVSRPVTTAKWLLKPRRSSGGLDVRFATAEALVRPPRGTYLQEFIDGQAASAVWVAADGQARLLGVTRQLVGRDFGCDRPFLYAGSIGPLTLSPAALAQLRLLGGTLAERSAMVGLFNVDFVLRADEIWPLEVNPRYSASVEILERVTDLPFIALHVSACTHSVLPLQPAAHGRCAGKAIVYAREPGTITAAVDRLIAQWNRPGQWPTLADLPRVGETFETGQPVMTVMAEGASIDEVEGLLRERIAVVEQALRGSPITGS